MDSGQQRHHPFPPIQNPKSTIVFLAVTISTTLIIFSAVLYFLYHLWRSLFHRSRTRPCGDSSPSPSDNLRRFTLRDLKDATDNFSSSNVIGKGGSGTVYRALLKDGKLGAVKLLDSSSSYQFEMEFQNEVRVLGGLKPGSSEFVVSLLGFCVENGRKAVVYEYMPNKSLQECLFSDRDLGLDWGKRFEVIQDVARALAFLHMECDPPVIHGDVKPSNVLLDIDFRAKISDFGLSRLKMEDEIGIDGDGGTAAGETMEDNDEVDFALALQASSSSKSSCKIYHNVLGLPNNSLNFGFNFENGSDDHKFVGNGVPYVEELSSVDHSKELNSNVDGDGDGAKQWGKDWWWRQDGSGELCSKDYVMEWIGSQICANPDKVDWDEEKGAIEERIVSTPVDNSSKRLDSCEELDKNGKGIIMEKEDSKRWKKVVAVKNHRKMHEWWKEERMDEEARKKKKLGGMWRRPRFKVAPHFGLGKCFEFKTRRSSFGCKNSHDNGEDDEENMEFSFRKGWRSKSKNHNNSLSMGSDMWSGDLFSRELSSTTSMRGTLCYVAPEYNGFGYLMEKADIYSFGVLILVIISGRRPLHVLSSPMKLEQANLISWSRSLAQTGNVLELVDERLGNEYNKEEASLCINLALACLQKMPELRPDIGDIVRILRGEMELPQVPYEFSPSPPAKNYSRSRRKQKMTAVD